MSHSRLPLRVTTSTSKLWALTGSTWSSGSAPATSSGSVRSLALLPTLGSPSDPPTQMPSNPDTHVSTSRHACSVDSRVRG